MSEQAPPVLRLARGTRQAVAVTEGTIILVRRGRVTLREPLAWLAETCIRAEHQLTAEATYTVTTCGWAEIAALDSAEVALIAGHKARRRLFRWQYGIESRDKLGQGF